jgi:uncharacterized protein YciW
MRRSLPVRASGDPTDRHAAAVEALRRAVFESPGSTEPAVRAAAGTGGELPDPVGSYATLVRDQSYRITDTELARLGAAGLSDDDIFEVTVAAAVGAALRRLDAGMRAVRGTA